MRRLVPPRDGMLATLAALALLALAPETVMAQAGSGAQQSLRNTLAAQMREAGRASGAYVVDLTTGQVLFASAARTPRLPASVEKVYTTTTALLRFGPHATLATAVLGRGTRGRRGAWFGTLYLRGGGDPTFGSAGFDGDWYGTGATMQRLVRVLRAKAHLTGVRGRIVGDESYFDSLRGTPATGFAASADVEGLLSALAYDRGFADASASTFQSRPALFAAAQFLGAMRGAGVKASLSTPLAAGRAPPGAKLLATVRSPQIATLIRLTNTPSDNFFAEMLLKDIGARFGRAGTTAAGAGVVRAALASKFGIGPQLDDGSGLSRADGTTPRQVVKVLGQMASNPWFVRSLAVAGESGTLAHEMHGTPAQGRCRGKTGTLRDVSNLVGYCTARDGHSLAFAFLMNSINPSDAHPIQNRMAVALARYGG